PIKCIMRDHCCAVGRFCEGAYELQSRHHCAKNPDKYKCYFPNRLEVKFIAFYSSLVSKSVREEGHRKHDYFSYIGKFLSIINYRWNALYHIWIKENRADNNK